MTERIQRIPLSYSNNDSRGSALRLLLTLRPDWKDSQETIDFIRFTDGITNTLLKAVNKLPGLSSEEIDKDAILLRAYGRDTEVLIDREKETKAHLLLAEHDLAPSLLARFENGLLYKYIAGQVCTPEDFRRKPIWRAIARRMGEWHARLPISAISSEHGTANGSIDSHEQSSVDSKNGCSPLQRRNPDDFTPNMPVPNCWSTMQKWIWALPTATDADKDRQARLQNELEWLWKELGDTPGIDNRPLVFSHCDLLSGNVIIEPTKATSATPADSDCLSVSLIDYEYASPAPASFDLANHFAEWGGFDCDFSVLPTRANRRDFLSHYLESYNTHVHRETNAKDLDHLCAEVDRLRGLPGFYWGIWGLIQALISQIDFDYASYAEVRFGEFHAWRSEYDGSRKAKGEEMPLRERRWAQEE
ncbi:kinase-like protein [Pseudovirgaria hyperparasitica]|uniref:ethanolamine kinase n=1 Tax=Pseudovirgaria hyperparasitica TaxID=470096 RepID=A0A6A6WIN1_9PEZI|nr:kinase-like protein [Pseudovirgaria hyperparasitica]KAF2762015.1 kinase-like protein [Pseudovirgaria hyperparasitica]